MTLKNLSPFQWHSTNNRVTLANIDNKYNKMKETAYVQSKIRIAKHLFKIYQLHLVFLEELPQERPSIS